MYARVSFPQIFQSKFWITAFAMSSVNAKTLHATRLSHLTNLIIPGGAHNSYFYLRSHLDSLNIRWCAWVCRLRGAQLWADSPTSVC